MQPPMGLSSELLWFLLLAVIGILSLIARSWIMKVNDTLVKNNDGIVQMQLKTTKIDATLEKIMDDYERTVVEQLRMHNENSENIKELEKTVMAAVNIMNRSGRGAGGR